MPKTLREQLEGKCVHFNGTQHKTCQAGVVYESVREIATIGRRYRLPCLFECRTCDKVERPTKESVDAEIAKWGKAAGDSAKVREAIVAMIGPWLKGIPVAGFILCPACGKGEVEFHRAARNGAIMARCSTGGCVAWME